MLKKLEEKQIFKIRKYGSKDFKFTEMCDGWYSYVLTKEQLLQLTEELIQLAKGK